MPEQRRTDDRDLCDTGCRSDSQGRVDRRRSAITGGVFTEGGRQVQSLDRYLPMLVLFSHPTLMYCDPSWIRYTFWYTHILVHILLSLPVGCSLRARWPGGGKRGGSLYLPDLPVNCRYWYSRVSSRVFLRQLLPSGGFLWVWQGCGGSHHLRGNAQARGGTT